MTCQDHDDCRATPELGLACVASRIRDAMWAGNTELLHELAPCDCCCEEHTYDSCPARQWYGCRGQETMTFADGLEWAAHYSRYHGMTEQEFFK